MTGRVRKILTGAGLAFMLALTFCMAAFAEDTTKFVPGTSINGIGIGNLNVDEAKVQIEGFYSGSYKLTITKKGGNTETINGTDIGYKVTVPDGLSAILEAQNASGRNSGPSVDNAHSMEMKAVYDEDALAGKIDGLSMISGSGIVVTSDARISDYQEGQPFTIIPEVQGNNVDVNKAAALLKNTVATGKTTVNLEEAGCYYQVHVTADSEQLKNLCNAMNQCRDMVITYTIGDHKETLPGNVICTWIAGSADGQISVNRDLAAAHVKTLADKYNTAGSTRIFRTTSGKEVSLKGPYGWKINQSAETDALIGMIRTGQTQEREPQYSQKAASRTGTEWGNTYIEIDLTGQHVYLYQNGVATWDSSCVTGNVSKGYTTPDGIYSLNYKEADRILRGEKKPDGTYEYESHVDFWMPFNGGIGLHDANWRGKFGGTIYQNNGSHGCVNLPPEKAKVLYSMISSGIPVICFS